MTSDSQYGIRITNYESSGSNNDLPNTRAGEIVVSKGIGQPFTAAF